MKRTPTQVPPPPQSLFVSNAVFGGLLIAVFLGSGIALGANQYLARAVHADTQAALSLGSGGHLAAEGGGGGTSPQGSTSASPKSSPSPSPSAGRPGGVGNTGSTNRTNIGGGGGNGVNINNQSGASRGNVPSANNNAQTGGGADSGSVQNAKDAEAARQAAESKAAEQRVNYARDLADYKNPNAPSRAQSISNTISNTTKALTNALGSIFKGGPLAGGPVNNSFTTPQKSLNQTLNDISKPTNYYSDLNTPQKPSFDDPNWFAKQVEYNKQVGFKTDADFEKAAADAEAASAKRMADLRATMYAKDVPAQSSVDPKSAAAQKASASLQRQLQNEKIQDARTLGATPAKEADIRNAVAEKQRSAIENKLAETLENRARESVLAKDGEYYNALDGTFTQRQTLQGNPLDLTDDITIAGVTNFPTKPAETKVAPRKNVTEVTTMTEKEFQKQFPSINGKLPSLSNTQNRQAPNTAAKVDLPAPSSQSNLAGKVDPTPTPTGAVADIISTVKKLGSLAGFGPPVDPVSPKSNTTFPKTNVHSMVSMPDGSKIDVQVNPDTGEVTQSPAIKGVPGALPSEQPKVNPGTRDGTYKVPTTAGGEINLTVKEGKIVEVTGNVKARPSATAGISSIARGLPTQTSPSTIQRQSVNSTGKTDLETKPTTPSVATKVVGRPETPIGKNAPAKTAADTKAKVTENPGTKPTATIEPAGSAPEKQVAEPSRAEKAVKEVVKTITGPVGKVTNAIVSGIKDIVTPSRERTREGGGNNNQFQIPQTPNIIGDFNQNDLNIPSGSFAPEVKTSKEELDLLVRVALAETATILDADGTINETALQATIEVIRNRAILEGEGVDGAIKRKSQFEAFENGRYAQSVFGPKNSSYKTAEDIAKSVLAGTTFPIAIDQSGNPMVNFGNLGVIEERAMKGRVTNNTVQNFANLGNNPQSITFVTPGKATQQQTYGTIDNPDRKKSAEKGFATVAPDDGIRPFTTLPNPDAAIENKSPKAGNPDEEKKAEVAPKPAGDTIVIEPAGYTESEPIKATLKETEALSGNNGSTDNGKGKKDTTTALSFPVGGSMEGASINNPQQVPESGGAKNSRVFGGPRAGGTFHTGVDIPGKIGDSIFAIQDGVVVRSVLTVNGYGNVVDVEYPDNTIHRMAHLGSRSVKIGDRVKKGDIVGVVGISGNANMSFEHVHYEVIKTDYYKEKNGLPPGREKTRAALEAGRVDPREYFKKIENARIGTSQNTEDIAAIAETTIPEAHIDTPVKPGVGGSTEGVTTPTALESFEKATEKVKTTLIEKKKEAFAGQKTTKITERIPTELKKTFDSIAPKLKAGGLSVPEASALLEQAYSAVVVENAVANVEFEKYDPKNAGVYTYEMNVPAGAIDPKYFDAFVPDEKTRASYKGQLAWAPNSTNVRIGVTVKEAALVKTIEKEVLVNTPLATLAGITETTPVNTVEIIDAQGVPLAHVVKSKTDGRISLDAGPQPKTEKPNGVVQIEVDEQTYEVMYKDGVAVTLKESTSATADVPKKSDYAPAPEPLPEPKPVLEKIVEVVKKRVEETRQDGCGFVCGIRVWLGFGGGGGSETNIPVPLFSEVATTSPSTNAVKK